MNILRRVLFAESLHLSFVSNPVVDPIPSVRDVAFFSVATIPDPPHDQGFDLEHRIAIFAFISCCAAMFQVRTVVDVIIWHIATICNRVQPSSAAVLADSAVRIPANGDVQVIQRFRVEDLAGEIAFRTMEILWICDG